MKSFEGFDGSIKRKISIHDYNRFVYMTYQEDEFQNDRYLRCSVSHSNQLSSDNQNVITLLTDSNI